MELRTEYHILHHSLAARRWPVYRSWLSLSFFLNINLISSFKRITCAFFADTCEVEFYACVFWNRFLANVLFIKIGVGTTC